MKLPPILVIGAADHGQVVAEAAESLCPGRVLGFVDDGMAVGTQTPMGKVVGTSCDLPDLLRRNPDAGLVIAIGDNVARRRCAAKLRALCPQASFPPVIHCDASVSGSASIGDGAVILAGTVVGAGATVGNFALINTRASLDHHAMLGDFASLAPGATTGGRVSIGAGAAVGLGAGILQGRAIGDDAVVGAMSLVYHDVPAGTVAYGVPEKITAQRDFSKPYLSSPASRRTALCAPPPAPCASLPKVVIIGAGGHGKEVAWNILRMNAKAPTYDILGFCDDAKEAGGTILDFPILGTLEQVAETHGTDLRYICAVAKNKVRPSLVARAEKAGWAPVSVIHPEVTIADDVEIGPGTYIGAKSYVGPGARIAAHALINVQATIGHDTTVEAHAQVCPGARVSGGAVIGRGTFIGSNAVVAPGKVVGEWSTVSATAFVATDLPARTLVTSPVSQHLAKPGKE